MIAWTNLNEDTVYTTSTVNPIVGDLTTDNDEITEIDYDMVGVPSAIHVNSSVYERNPSGDLETNDSSIPQE